MKNKTQSITPRSETKVLDWLNQEEQEEDFLLGKTPQDFQDIEDEEE